MMFYYGDIELEVPENMYYPQEDSLLIAKMVEIADLTGKKCLDMGCGSGFLSILMIKKAAIVTAVDIDKDAVASAIRNTEMNNADMNIVQSDLFEKIDGKFDLIVFNAPYLPVDDKYTHESYDGGKTGREVVERFLKEAKKYMNKDGKILLLVSSLTGEKEVIDFAKSCNLNAIVIEREKIDWEELIVLEIDQTKSVG